MASPSTTTTNTPPLPTGIWAPTQVFFHPPPLQDLDLPTTAAHAVRLARAGIAGIVTNGSNGEAVHLSRAERAAVTRATRTVLDAAGFAHVPVMAGASAQSVRETVELIQDARDAGAEAVLVLCASFYAHRGGVRDAAGEVEGFFEGVARGAVLPVVVYNYPGAVGGLDLDSEALVRLASLGEVGRGRIVGTKFTCGNVGKLARVTGRVGGVRGEYRCFSGVADAITPALAVGGHGGIVGAANVFPRACVNVYRLFVEGKWEEARAAQQQLALADWVLTKRAIPGFKSILQKYHGYGGLPRLPVLPLSGEQEETLFAEIEEMMRLEESLEDFGRPIQP
jgi:L-threo-3-deoxy-hexylosonate aldolase